MKKVNLLNIKNALSRAEMRSIMAGSGRGGSCTASPNCCSTVSCGCPDGGTCSADDNSATCTCDNGTTNKVNCPT